MDYSAINRSEKVRAKYMRADLPISSERAEEVSRVSDVCETMSLRSEKVRE